MHAGGQGLASRSVDLATPCEGLGDRRTAFDDLRIDAIDSTKTVAQLPTIRGLTHLSLWKRVCFAGRNDNSPAAPAPVEAGLLSVFSFVVAILTDP